MDVLLVLSSIDDANRVNMVAAKARRPIIAAMVGVDFMRRKSMDYIATGSRAEMAAMERVLTERVPGPLSLESLAASEYGNDMDVLETIVGGTG
jgi:hypothetical protein